MLHKYDLLLDGIAGPNDNIVHFGADETTNASAVIPTSQFNPSGVGEGQTLYLTGGYESDGLAPSKNMIQDDFTLLYYNGNYSLFDL